MMAASRAVVLVSGGLDSATTLAIARAAGHDTYALSVDYGQRHRVELDAARRVARAAGVADHRIMRVDLAGIGGSALTDSSIAVPEAPTDGIPVTYVPARNTIMLSLALGWAEVLDARHIRVTRIEAPLVSLSKADVIRTGIALGVDYGLTLSCYQPDAGGRACGKCDSCRLRRDGFVQAGVRDPTPYA